MKKFLLLLIVKFVLTACVPTFPDTAREVITEDGFEYTVLEIEGMTCIYYERNAIDEGYAGLTCNWDEWVKK